MRASRELSLNFAHPGDIDLPSSHLLRELNNNTTFNTIVMKTLGLLGGMSWESTVTYYQEINRRVRAVRGGLSSAQCIIFSFDFAQIEALQHAGKWDEAGQLLGQAATSLQRAGADAIVLCTNTMHYVAHAIVSACPHLPIIHIADATATEIQRAGYKSVGLIGTKFTMEKAFYKNRLHEKFGLRVHVPNESDQALVHRVIYTELCNGIINEESRSEYLAIIDRLTQAGAECLILGCTEIGLLIDNTATNVPLFDTAKIHAIAAADWAMDA